MELKTVDQRLHYIDHLRGFMFIIMALDHSLHAYAQKFGRFWFFYDVDRSEVFDMFYVFDQSIIMPMIFFTIGMFVFSSIKRRGLLNFAKERLIRIGIPFVVGVPFIVPILSYPKFEHNEMPGLSFWDFWTQYYFTEKLQGGPFWVMYAILLYTAILVAIYYILPPVYRLWVWGTKWAADNPVWGFLLFGFKCTVVLGVSDWIWGAPWWIGFLKIFNLQASRILLVVIYFFVGATAVSAGLFSDNKFIDKIADNWLKFALLTAVLGGAYMICCVEYFDIVYGEPLLRLKQIWGEWPKAIEVSEQFLPGIIVRTTLLGYLGLSQALLLLAIFRKFFSKPTRMWTSLASNAWGIFIIHESIVVWMQYYLIDSGMSIYGKFLITATVGISMAWLLSDLLRRVPGIGRVLGPQKFKG